MNSDASAAGALARRLIEQANSDAQVAYARTCRVLSQSLGAAGFHALLTRALSQTERDHALLTGIRVQRLPEPVLGNLPGLVAAHGASAVDAALFETLETLLGLLGRLVGEDMVARLVDHGGVAGTEDEEEDR